MFLASSSSQIPFTAAEGIVSEPKCGVWVVGSSISTSGFIYLYPTVEDLGSKFH